MRYGIGIDISKGKSTVAIVNEEKKLEEKVFEIRHVKEDMEKLQEKIEELGKEEVKIVMEATGRYHLPVYNYLLKKGDFVVNENAYLIKKYLDKGIRKAKTDKKDAKKIAEYVIDNWRELRKATKEDEKYEDLRFLSREYASQVSNQVKQKIEFSNTCDLVFPGYYGVLTRDNFKLGLEIFKKYGDVEKVQKMKREEFVEKVCKIGEKMQQKRAAMTLAHEIYQLAQNVIVALPIKPVMQNVINKEIENLLQTINTTNIIITEMEKIAIQMPEYIEISKMDGVGRVLGVLIVAEIGDIKRFKNAGSLIAYAGIDAPAYQSGAYELVSRRISKRGNKYLRKIIYSVTQSIKCGKKGEIYEYIIKKEKEGKPRKVAKLAGANKFLRMYYGKMKKIYK